MNLINHNGTIHPGDTPLLSVANRAFRYGDGLFETMRFDGERIPLLFLHLERLQAGMTALGLTSPGHWNPVFFEDEVTKITTPGQAARVRLAVFRSGEGFYTPESDLAEYVIENQIFTPKSPPEPIPRSGFIPEISLSPGQLSAFKTSNGLPYVLASRIRQQRCWQEGLLLNQAGRIADGCHSNLFLVKGDTLVTPPVSEGPIAGVMRSVILHMAQVKGLRHEVRPIEATEYHEATEVWFSNALTGARWVQEFEGRKMKNQVWREFLGQENGFTLTTKWKNQ